MPSETILFSLPTGDETLHGNFCAAGEDRGIVLLSRMMPSPCERTRIVREAFHHAGWSTFSVALLTSREAHFSENSGICDNVPLLCQRLRDFLDHLKRYLTQEKRGHGPWGLYAQEAASPAALRLAAEREISALVCRGGLIDRAGTFYLNMLSSPFLFIADRNDAAFLAMADSAFQKIGAEKERQWIDPSAPDANPATASSAVAWFLKHLDAAAPQ